ncbi:unnamed protein product [Cuscuta epithymum]|uniref:Uncharacterized protein n=1 Tax=Cuscuta epithymum TaxID=186058 RepID=A0AAV0D430_9ASTE|nr:unnamed protein product [Cuscuta epithymum]
MQRELEQHER